MKQEPRIDDLVKQAAQYVAANEGRRNQVYKDSKGLDTVGVGHLVTQAEKKKFAGRTLTDAEVDSILEKDLSAKIALAKRKLGSSFDALPQPAQVAVVDGFFRGDLSGSPKSLKLLKEGKLEEAANEYLDNKEYRDSLAKNAAGKPHGVAPRMERNAALLRQASVQAAPPLNPLVLTGPLAQESVISVRLPLSL